MQCKCIPLGWKYAYFPTSKWWITNHPRMLISCVNKEWGKSLAKSFQIYSFTFIFSLTSLQDGSLDCSFQARLHYSKENYYSALQSLHVDGRRGCSERVLGFPKRDVNKWILVNLKEPEKRCKEWAKYPPKQCESK